MSVESAPDGSVSAVLAIRACSTALQGLGFDTSCHLQSMPGQLPGPPPTTLREMVAALAAVEAEMGGTFVWSVGYHGATPAFHGRYWAPQPPQIGDRDAILDVNRRIAALTDDYRRGRIDATTFEARMADLTHESHAIRGAAEARAVDPSELGVRTGE
ncbi:MAG: hypothetical protein R3F61_00600 [Myxococcota bacterium]